MMTKRMGIGLSLLLLGFPLLGLLAAVSGQPVLQPLRQLAIVPSLALISTLLWLFGRTLLPGREPLVAAIARSVHGPLAPAVARYTRRLTQLWALLLALLLGEIILVAWLAPPAGTTLLLNLLNPGLVALVFIAEFFWRRRCLPDVQHISFKHYLQLLRQLDFRKLSAS
ncbi:MAG: hypothetical protein R3F53_19775 [Gammaproteobacteria bacterium]